MKKYPEPRLEITIRDWCPIKDEPIWASQCMELDAFTEFKDPNMVLKEIIKHLKNQVKLHKEHNQKRQLEEHREKLNREMAIYYDECAREFDESFKN